MHIQKTRLLTPGPTPILPQAAQAMLGAGIHHRTAEFRELYRGVLADLQAALGTAHDVLVMACSGTGAMEAAVANCFSPGDRVIVCSAGKFGERWVELTRAFGLDAVVIGAPYGQVVEPAALQQALAAHPEARGVFVQASESSTGAAHDVRAMGTIVKATGALFVVDAWVPARPGTKEAVNTFGKLGLESALVLGMKENQNLFKSIRNAPKYKFLPVEGANVYDILRHQSLVLTRDAAQALQGVLA